MCQIIILLCDLAMQLQSKTHISLLSTRVSSNSVVRATGYIHDRESWVQIPSGTRNFFSEFSLHIILFYIDAEKTVLGMIRKVSVYIYVKGCAIVFHSGEVSLESDNS